MESTGFVEYPEDLRLLRTSADVNLVLEACFATRVQGVLLHPANLPERFFDLSSGEAGAILQKLRNYKIRFALVCPAGTVRWNARFDEMVIEENKGNHFHLFESIDQARDWLNCLPPDLPH